MTTVPATRRPGAPAPHACRTSWRFLAGLLVLLAAAPVHAQRAETVRAHLAATASSGDVHRFYAARGFAPAWVSAGRLLAPGASLLRALRAAPTHGLDGTPYHLAEAEGLLARGALDDAGAATLDVLLTRAFFAHANDLLKGRVAPRSLHPGWSVPARTMDLPAALAAHLGGGDLAPLFAALAPATPAYTRLRGALAAYRARAARGGWPLLSAGGALRVGSRGERVRALRDRLTPMDAPVAGPPDSADVFDASLDGAVRAFQARHGLGVDGIVGPATRAALNVPVEARIAQIVLNLERLRWLPEAPGPRHVRVNLPAFSLTAFDQGAPVLHMGVVIGKTSTPTPLFSTAIRAVVLAPAWEVPASIARGEIAPLVRRDPGYLARHGMHRLPGGGFRQDPGPTNPLGQVKFTIPNPYGVGLHDTPARGLFALPVRAFSHGCIRLERPLELAAFALGNPTPWTRDRLEATIARWRQTSVPIPAPLPLYVLYETAWVADDGTVHFRDDLYGHDARLRRVLMPADRAGIAAGAPPSPQTAVMETECPPG